jgi:hypothetical protein
MIRDRGALGRARHGGGRRLDARRVHDVHDGLDAIG